MQGECSFCDKVAAGTVKVGGQSLPACVACVATLEEVGTLAQAAVRAVSFLFRRKRRHVCSFSQGAGGALLPCRCGRSYTPGASS